MTIDPSDPSHQPSPSIHDRLRSIRADLIRSIVAIDLRLSATAPEIGGLDPNTDTSTALPLKPVLDGLEASGDVRILRHLAPDIVEVSTAERLPGTSVALVVDVETTGLDHSQDEVIELGLLRFEHLDGFVTRVTGELCALREPDRPISPEITRLTGITPEMVAERQIDRDAVSDMLLGVDLVIAHNARFDRPFCEALDLGFASLPWACSVDEIDWRSAGFEGAKLGHLLLQSGSFHRGHRALDDCRVLLHLLRLERPTAPGGEVAPLLRGLVASAGETRRRVWAEGAPFERKDLLKTRGYRWSPGSTTAPRAWWRDVAEQDFIAEVQFLHTEVYGRYRILRTERLTARERYRGR